MALAMYDEPEVEILMTGITFWKNQTWRITLQADNRRPGACSDITVVLIQAR